MNVRSADMCWKWESHDERADRLMPIGRSGGCGNYPQPPEFLVESDAVTGDGFREKQSLVAATWRRILDVYLLHGDFCHRVF